MSDIKRLIIGITLVAVGLGMILSANKVLPWVGGVLGIIGCVITIKVIMTGHLK